VRVSVGRKLRQKTNVIPLMALEYFEEKQLRVTLQSNGYIRSLASGFSAKRSFSEDIRCNRASMPLYVQISGN